MRFSEDGQYRVSDIVPVCQYCFTFADTYLEELFVINITVTFVR